MTMGKKSEQMLATGAVAILLSSVAVADGDNGMEHHVEGASDAKAMSAAFASDMARLESEMGTNIKARAAATSADGIHGTVVPISRMKTLVVKKNEDGTFTMGHVSDAKDVEEFMESDTVDQAAEEE